MSLWAFTVIEKSSWTSIWISSDHLCFDPHHSAYQGTTNCTPHTFYIVQPQCHYPYWIQRNLNALTRTHKALTRLRTNRNRYIYIKGLLWSYDYFIQNINTKMITFILEKTGQAYRSVSWEHPLHSHSSVLNNLKWSLHGFRLCQKYGNENWKRESERSAKGWELHNYD